MVLVFVDNKLNIQYFLAQFSGKTRSQCNAFRGRVIQNLLRPHEQPSYFYFLRVVGAGKIPKLKLSKRRQKNCTHRSEANKYLAK